ncbi:MAG: prepilin peptidase [Anaerolineae bacterium]|nr:prepilin peptidase [Anaerolineae bacterium]MBN8618575.1 prepilin peptidase [Anaerolineae bacterium]
MMVLVGVIGWLAGWLINWASDYLPRFASTRAPEKLARPITIPALVALASGRAAWRDGWTRLHAVVEAGSAVFFGVMWWQLGATTALLFTLVGYCFFALIAVIDFKYRLVLNVLMYPALVALLVFNLLALPEQRTAILLGGGMAFAIFFLTAWLRPGELGGGDVKLATVIGVTFGFPQMLLALLVGAGIGAGVAVMMMLTRQAGRKTRIPYAPFLCLGAMALLLSHAGLMIY